MVVFRSLITLSEKLLSRAKWSLKVHSDISRFSTLVASTKADIPSPPKRPPTAYMIFCQQNRPYVLKDNPGLSGTELIKVLAEKWTSLTPILKKPYEETARENTIVYGKLHKEFYENLTEDQRTAMEKLKIAKRENRKIQKLKKALKVSGMPRLPNNAYTVFVQTKAKEYGDIKNGPNFIKQVAEDWKILSEEDKKVFYEKAKDEKLKYESEIASWRERLTEKGNIDLLKSFEEGKFRQRAVSAADPGTAGGATKKKVSATKKSQLPKNETAPKN